jgi:hypothetical protein
LGEAFPRNTAEHARRTNPCGRSLRTEPDAMTDLGHAVGVASWCLRPPGPGIPPRTDASPEQGHGSANPAGLTDRQLGGIAPHRGSPPLHRVAEARRAHQARRRGPSRRTREQARRRVI